MSDLERRLHGEYWWRNVASEEAMSDIVERLRDSTTRWVALSEPDPLRLEAADEIERLRAALQEIADMSTVGTRAPLIARAALGGK